MFLNGYPLESMIGQNVRITDFAHPDQRSSPPPSICMMNFQLILFLPVTFFVTDKYTMTWFQTL